MSRRETLDDFLAGLERPDHPAVSRPPIAPPRLPRHPLACRLCPRPFKHVCVSCGSRVCATHHWALLGLCHVCASEEEVRAGAAGSRHGLGIKWVE